MARDMRARFTALYVQTGKRERESDKRRLEAHVQFAKESGAEIVMTHGENVPVQIAEYAHLSNVTKIVIGQSSAKRNHFFSKQTLTEKLIEAVPDIDIHIIPDAMNLDNYRKPHGAVYVGKPTMKDSLLTLFIFAVCTLIGLFIQKLQFTDTNIVTIYILGVLLTSILTDGYLYSIGGSALSVFFVLLFPYGTKNVISDICSWISGNFCDHVNIFCHYWNTCSKIKNTCKAFSTICISYTDFI